MQGRLTQLVEDLVARHALSSEAVAQAFLAVPRHLFVPQARVDEAYIADKAIPTHFDRRGVSTSSSSAPSIMAVMLELLSVTPGQRVLEIGAGTGYNAALLAHLVGEAGAVTSLDIDEDVAREACEHLATVGAERVEILCKDGWLGEPRNTPFDRIIVTVECWDICPIGSASSTKEGCSSYPWRSVPDSRWRSRLRRSERPSGADQWPRAGSCPSADLMRHRTTGLSSLGGMGRFPVKRRSPGGSRCSPTPLRNVVTFFGRCWTAV